MFSFLHKINPKKRDTSTVSATTTTNGVSYSNDFQHINDIKNDLLPTSIEFSPDLIPTHFPSGYSNGKLKNTPINSNKKSSPSSSSHASTVNEIIMTASTTTSSSKESTGSSKLLPFGKNNPFGRKSSHMSSLASLGSGYFTTGRLKNKSSSTSLGTLSLHPTPLYLSPL